MSTRPIENVVPGAYFPSEARRARCSETAGAGRPGYVTIPSSIGWESSTKRRGRRHELIRPSAASAMSESAPRGRGRARRSRRRGARPCAGCRARCGRAARPGARRSSRAAAGAPLRAGAGRPGSSFRRPAGRTSCSPRAEKPPRFAPVSRRRTAYFQYAACTASSHALCRPGDGRHAACSSVRRRSEPFKFGPCQAGAVVRLVHDREQQRELLRGLPGPRLHGFTTRVRRAADPGRPLRARARASPRRRSG